MNTDPVAASTAPIHRYRVRCSWQGSTGVGYEHYRREHTVSSPPAAGELNLSSDPAFRGDPSLLNPEQLLVLAASSCQLLSFLAVAARARLDVVSYEDDAEAEMPEAERPIRITTIRLHPRIVLVPGKADEARVRQVGRSGAPRVLHRQQPENGGHRRADDLVVRSPYMNVIFCAIAIWLGYCLAVHGQAADKFYYGSDNTSPPPLPFPSAYQNYQILPGTISPNQQYALIYPKRSLIYELSNYGLYLVAFTPFRVLSQIPLGNSNLAASSRCYYAANWSNDSSAVVMIAGSRWGPEKVSVVAIQEGKATKRTELTAQVRRIVRASFQKSRAKRYNNYYDFVFSRGYFSGDDYINVPEGTNQQGWNLDDGGHVLIDCVCTTDPKDAEPRHWTVRFNGLWDIGKGVFLKKEYGTIPFSQAL